MTTSQIIACAISWTAAIVAATPLVLARIRARRGHVYLSTGCLHGDHGYCQNMTGLAGAKRPGECKHCGAKCTCRCHLAQARTFTVDDGGGAITFDRRISDAEYEGIRARWLAAYGNNQGAHPVEELRPASEEESGA